MSNAKLNLRGVHVYEKINGQAMFRLKETHPAMRLAHSNETFHIQDGLVFEESGKQVPWENVPGWVLDAMELANPVAAREAGWKGRPASQKAK
jgi:hypothetical protein